MKLEASNHWVLTEFGEGELQRRTLSIPSRTCTVGRSSEADLCLSISGISKQHARLFVENEQLFVEDLKSTNGTYVNGDRIEYCAVVDGDLLQFANALFRVGHRDAPQNDGTMEEGLIPWAQTLLMFDRLLSEKRVVPHFQAIIAMSDRMVVEGYELLARSDFPELKNPAAMFGAAERLGQQAALSELMRSEGLRIAAHSSQATATYFLNTHPVEIGTERLGDSVKSLREAFPTSKIVIEIHEAAVTEPNAMREFQRLLRDLSMELAYDDFGAGQGRLVELGEAPPDVLKFDMQLIRDIDQAPASRQELLKSLVRISTELGSTPLAEGVETEAEHQVCVELGFTLGQGYLYGRPAPFS